MITLTREQAEQVRDALKDLNLNINEAMGTGGWVPTPLHKSFWHAVVQGNDAIAILDDALAERREPETNPDFYCIPVEYQYAYPDGHWRCSNGERINGSLPTKSRGLYARKDSL